MLDPLSVSNRINNKATSVVQVAVSVLHYQDLIYLLGPVM
jgi:hypothetical protein